MFALLTAIFALAIMIIVLIGTFITLPAGLSDSFYSKATKRHTAWLRQTSGKRVLYWAIPIIMLVVLNTLAGVLLIFAAMAGVRANRLIAMQ